METTYFVCLTSALVSIVQLDSYNYFVQQPIFAVSRISKTDRKKVLRESNFGSELSSEVSYRKRINKARKAFKISAKDLRLS